jgi:trans-2,3-dihydro-3-hydroxyanthranilate isomerase
VLGELEGDGARLLATALGQRAQVVRLSLLGVRVANEKEEHRGARIPRYCGAVTRLRYVHVDVFTDRPLEGNQLAVFTDARGLDGETMQALARETALSESVFVTPAEQGGTVRIRIFTPRSELPFAGHPVLGAAWVLAAPLQLGVIELETGRGLVRVELDRDESGAIAFGRMTQPIPSVETFPDPDELLSALRVDASLAPIETYDNGPRFTLVVLGSPQEVAAVRPDLGALEALGVQAACFAGGGVKWKTRMFAPAFGVAEDPATGSAAGPLACHVCRHGLADWGEWLEISQGAEILRPSTLFARAEGTNGTIERVACGGRAVVVARGEFSF